MASIRASAEAIRCAERSIAANDRLICSVRGDTQVPFGACPGELLLLSDQSERCGLGIADTVACSKLLRDLAWTDGLAEHRRQPVQTVNAHCFGA